MNAKEKLLSKLHIKHSTHSNESSLLSNTEHHVKKEKSNTQLIFAAAILVILVALVVFVVLPMTKSSQTTPTNVTGNTTVGSPIIFLVKDSTCTKCFKLDTLVAQAFSGLNVTNVESTSEKGKELIAKYALTKVPAVVIQNYPALDIGTQTALESISTKIGDSIILYSPVPPYLELSTGKLVGEISLTVVTADNCTACSNFSDLKAQLETQNVLVTNYSLYSSSSTEGKQLIQKYKVNFAPFIIFSKELSAYKQIAGVWNTVGVIANDGSYVQTIPNPPVLNLTTGKIEGLVSLTYLNDSSCKTCYDVTVHKKALEQPPLGLRIVNTSVIDISSAQGKVLIAKYNVTQVPTVIVSKEAALYKTFTEVWPQVGLQNIDGTFIISDLSKLSGITYKDLTTGTVTTNPATQTQ